MALLALTLAGPPARAQDTFPTELQTVSGVRFEGRHALKPRDLYAVMKTKPPSALPWRQEPRLRRDFLRADTLAIETLYRQHGYLDARAQVAVRTARRDPGRAIVTFAITEGRRSRIRAVEFGGVTVFSGNELGRQLYARAGRPFNPSYLVADTTRIANAYQERGYLAHATSALRRDSLAVLVRYDVLEGPLYHLGQVQISGLTTLRVDESLARRELLLHEGEAFKRSRVERSLEHLYDTGLFSQAQISTLADSSRQVIDFDLRLVERKPRWLDAGVGSGTSDAFRFLGEWGHRNLAGQGLNGVVGANVSLDSRGRFQRLRTSTSLLQPWLFRTRTRGVVSLYYQRNEDRADERWVVAQEAKGITFQAYRELGRRGRITLTQDNTFVVQHLHDVNADLQGAVLDSLLLHVRPSYATHRLALSGLRDRRDDPLSATTGSTQSLSAEIAGGPLQGASSFSKGLLSSSWYTPLRNGWVLATRAGGGIIRPFGSDEIFSPQVGLDPEVARVPLEDRFRLGGVNSVRGFNENELQPSGGLAMALAGAELRVPVVGPFGVELFVDAGNVWSQPRYMKWSNLTPRSGHTLPSDGDVRYVFGAGGTLMLPFGPLRVDLTWSARPVDASGRWFVREPQFAIGPSF